MATMYCALCQRPVEAKRFIGAGTIFLALLSAGFSLLALPFYPKRCSICRSTAVSDVAPDLDGRPGGVGSIGRMAALERRLAQAEEELETTAKELERVESERDFYRELRGSQEKG